jgi:hypothetical protein
MCGGFIFQTICLKKNLLLLLLVSMYYKVSLWLNTFSCNLMLALLFKMYVCINVCICKLNLFVIDTEEFGSLLYIYFKIELLNFVINRIKA